MKNKMHRTIYLQNKDNIKKSDIRGQQGKKSKTRKTYICEESEV